MLTNPDARNAVIDAAKHFATQHVPAGPQHDFIVQQVAQQVTHTLNQVFDALKLSLAVAIQHGLLTVLVFSVAMIVGSFFLKDIPMKGAPDKAGEDEGLVEEQEEVSSSVQAK